MKVLIVEDEEKLAKLLQRGFSKEGIVADILHDGHKAEQRLLHGRDEYDLVLLDRMIPSLDGVSLLLSLRGQSVTIPVIMLTARDATSDIVEGLSAGADDYVIKPFSFDELLARAHALLRRPKKELHRVFSAMGLELSRESNSVSLRGKPLALTAKEFAILAMLLAHKGEIVTRGALLSHCWEHAFNPFSNVVDVHIKNLRKKINTHEEILHTIRGVGYRIDDR